MTLADKVAELKGKKAALLKKANKLTAKLESDFREEKSNKSNVDKIKSFTGRFNAVVGPLLKQAKELEKAIELLG